MQRGLKKGDNEQKKSPPQQDCCGGLLKENGGKRRRPTLPLLRSTIGVTGLNFSVRNGKRWNPGAIAT